MQSHSIDNVMAPTKIPPYANGALAAAFTLGLACTAQAQIYMCKDANGRTLTSDRPIPECANRAVKELSKDGVVKREIPPPLTPEQIRQKKEAEEKKKAEEAAIAEQKRRDAAIMGAYQNEAQIEAERQRSVSQLRNNINIAITAQNNAEQRRKALQTEADGLTKSGKPVPPTLLARVADSQRTINQESRNIAGMEEDMLKIKLKYDDLLKRFRAINGEPGAPEASASGKK
jgi:hypothetical protein